MVSVATIPSIGEEHVLVVIVANPVATALGLCKFLVLAAKPASRLVRFRFGWCYHVFSFRRTTSYEGSHICLDTHKPPHPALSPRLGGEGWGEGERSVNTISRRLITGRTLAGGPG